MHDVCKGNDDDVMEEDTDDSLSTCIQSESRKELALKFYSQESSTGKESDSDHLSNSDEDEEIVLGQHGQVKQRRQTDEASARRQDSQHIKWADECQKELCRVRPRKKYIRHPGKTIPLKSILKGMQN